MRVRSVEKQLDLYYEKLAHLLNSISEEVQEGQWTYDSSVKFLNKLNYAQHVLKRYEEESGQAHRAVEALGIIKQQLLELMG
jgi:hypothetical protein